MMGLGSMELIKMTILFGIKIWIKSGGVQFNMNVEG